MNPIDIGQWISSYGFPSAIAIYLLIRIEPAIKELTKTVTLLSVVVAKTNGIDYEKVKRDYQKGN
ncbi:MAG: YvrJ family protein [Halanaerobiales bacterium]|nr:YvrJ family protein [Halanaerobiales bacterium]